MKYTVLIQKEKEDGFIDSKIVCDYDDFEDVKESGSQDEFVKKVKGQIRFHEVGLKLAGLTSWDNSEVSQEGGSALTAPSSVEFVFYREFDEDVPVSEEEIKDAIAFVLTHSYEAPMDVWHPQTKTEPSGKVIMPIGFLTEFVRAEALYDDIEQAKASVTVTIE